MSSDGRFFEKTPLYAEEFGPFIATVISRNDPDQLYRIKAKEMTRAGGEINWARPIGFDPKGGNLPQVGDNIIIFYEHGDIAYPFWMYGPPRDGDREPEHELFPPTDQNSGKEIKKSSGGQELGFSDTKGDQKIWLSTVDKKNRIELRQDVQSKEGNDEYSHQIGLLLKSLFGILAKCTDFNIEAIGNTRIETNNMTIVALNESLESVTGDKTIVTAEDLNMMAAGDITIHSLGGGVNGAKKINLSIGVEVIPVVEIEMDSTGHWQIGTAAPMGRISGEQTGVTIGTGESGLIATAMGGTVNKSDSYVPTMIGMQKIYNQKQIYHKVG